MYNTDFPRFVLLLVIVFSGITLKSQTTKEAVILYNSKPVLAEITTEGSVNKIISEEPDFLKGFTLKVMDYGQVVADQQNKANKPSNPVVSITTAPASQAYAVESHDFKSIPFEAEYATLSDLAIERLDEVISHLKTHTGSKIVLRSLSLKDDSLINKNRLNSIQTYLKIRGIDIQRVSFESLVGDLNANEIKVHFLD
ncbi:MAG: hypothetical protein IPL08_20395 [Saprospiraceae bacterium]|nr:hypothetical protein [Saprospiraceae bacterium]MBK8670986.1 hypothetical protein [Saprospiraceae bacterium]